MAKGQNLVRVNERPWDATGTKVESCKTGEALCRKAKMDFDVVKVPVMGVLGEDEGFGIDNRYVIARKDTLDVLSDRRLVTSDYELLQNRDAFPVLDALVADGQMTYDAAGYSRGGGICWATAKLGSSIIERLDGTPDEIAHFIAVTIGHDGRRGIAAGLTPLRMFCNNQEDALVKGIRTQFSISHRGNAAERLAEAQKLLLDVRVEYEKVTEYFQKLAKERMTPRQFRAFANRLLDSITKKETEETRAKKVEELLGYFQHGMGNTGETLWDGYNSITEWLDHRLDRMEEGKRTAQAQLNHLDGLWFGKARTIKQRALNLLTK